MSRRWIAKRKNWLSSYYGSMSISYSSMRTDDVTHPFQLKMLMLKWKEYTDKKTKEEKKKERYTYEYIYILKAQEELLNRRLFIFPNTKTVSIVNKAKQERQRQTVLALVTILRCWCTIYKRLRRGHAPYAYQQSGQEVAQNRPVRTAFPATNRLRNICAGQGIPSISGPLSQ